MVERDLSGFATQPQPNQHPSSIANISYYAGPGNLDMIAFGGSDYSTDIYQSAAGQQNSQQQVNPNEIIFLGFNQDQSCITVGT